MSARLRLASLWMPRFMMARELDRIRSATDATLDALLAEHAPEAIVDKEARGRGLEERRAAMARGHRRKVEALIEAVGRERAIGLGREALFLTGLALGLEARQRLGVGDGRDDLLRAAGIMYRILGIEFTVGPEGLEVTCCALSRHYSGDVCRVLSAVDEGAVSGLSPRASMRFDSRMTDPGPVCVASIEFSEGT
ncbi:MAG: hypothetical protein ISF22_06150 [Methanomassiliicoccus sp.]|nr:hypothetical protein [Methanomassiliicoccus sp.]